MLIDFGSLMVVDTALRSSAVGGLVGKNSVVAAELAASDVLVHTAAEVVAYADIHGRFGFGIENTVFPLDRRDFAGIEGTERRYLDRSARFVKRHNITFLSEVLGRKTNKNILHAADNSGSNACRTADKGCKNDRRNSFHIYHFLSGIVIP